VERRMESEEETHMVRLTWMIGWVGLLSVLARGAENAAELTLVYPCRPAADSLEIDGRLDPAEWAGAAEVSGFRTDLLAVRGHSQGRAL